MSDSDDELIHRLSRAAHAGTPPQHDPYLDLPMAHEVAVSADAPPTGDLPVCGARARRALDVRGIQAVTPTEEVRCELAAGHPGAHQAHFTRSRFTHHWHAVEWPAPSPGA